MMRHAPRLLLALPLLLCAHRASAQTPLLTLPIDSGRVVRVHTRDGSVQRGRLLAPFGPGTDRMRFCRYPGNPCTSGDTTGVRVLSAADLTHLEVAVGSHAAQRALLGGLLGFAGGVLLGHLTASLCEAHCPDPLSIGLAVGAAETLLGALMGSADLIWAPAP